jgi:RNA polymerase sigma-70 factor (ECF subfamily)
LELTAVASSNVENAVLDRDLTEKLLANIPDEDRALLQMMYSEEMSVADIAEALGLSASNVKVRAWRARATIRKILRRFL